MKILVIQLIFLFYSITAVAQSKAMKNLAEEYPEATSFVIYHSHFTMLNQNDDPDIAALASSIEKIKVLSFDDFTAAAKKKLESDLVDNDFESLMTIKHDKANITAFIMEDEGEIEGYFLIVKTEDNTMVIDVVGSPEVKQISKIIDIVKNH